MTFKNVCLVLCAFLLVHQSVAQTKRSAPRDGEIVDKTSINSFDELIEYIRKTEQRDTVELDPSRFAHFQEVDVFGLTYGSDGLKVKGFLLKPKGAGPYPAVIYNRGGSLEWGSLTHFIASIGLGELAMLAREGYVVIASQYRGNGGSEGLEEYGGRDIHDVLNLIPLLETIPEADTANIGMFGWSRGGAQTFSTMRKTNRIKAVAVGGPGTDLVAVAEDRPELPEWWATFIPDYYENEAQILKTRSPVYWVDELPRDVPILMMHGTADSKAKPIETLQFALELDKYRVPYRLIMFEGGHHALREHQQEVFDQLIRWFDRFLKQGEPVPDLSFNEQ